jgi:DNA-nicking Smr family endonuclease
VICHAALGALAVDRSFLLDGARDRVAVEKTPIHTRDHGQAHAKPMSRRRQLSEEEEALWNGFARSITPLRHPQKTREKTLLPPAAKKLQPQRPAPPPPTPPTPPTPPLAPLERRLKQRVARGRAPIDARIDLHGFTQNEAYRALLRFLERAQADGRRIVLVVTGKGGRESHDRASERGVLRRQVPLWLELPEFRALVVGFGNAHAGHGGDGALYVRLRRRR